MRGEIQVGSILLPSRQLEAIRLVDVYLSNLEIGNGNT